jgi:hypothetical protein
VERSFFLPLREVEMDALFLPKNVHFLQEILCNFDFFFIIDSDKKISNWRR